MHKGTVLNPIWSVQQGTAINPHCSLYKGTTLNPHWRLKEGTALNPHRSLHKCIVLNQRWAILSVSVSLTDTLASDTKYQYQYCWISGIDTSIGIGIAGSQTLILVSVIGIAGVKTTIFTDKSLSISDFQN